MASVNFPEDPKVVEPVLQHVCMDTLPAAADIIQVLPLAHRLELDECVTDAAAAMDDYARWLRPWTAAAMV